MGKINPNTNTNHNDYDWYDYKLKDGYYSDCYLESGSWMLQIDSQWNFFIENLNVERQSSRYKRIIDLKLYKKLDKYEKALIAITSDQSDKFKFIDGLIKTNILRKTKEKRVYGK